MEPFSRVKKVLSGISRSFAANGKTGLFIAFCPVLLDRLWTIRRPSRMLGFPARLAYNAGVSQIHEHLP